MSKRIWLSLAQMGGGEMKFIQEAFDSNWVVPLGPNVDGFEKNLEEYLGGEKSVVALSSGTAALHLALVMQGVGPGDEVICQSFTFSASANPIAYLGAKPVFVDSEAQTWNISPEYLEKAIIDRKAKTGTYPKAIIPVHLYGMPAKMDEITTIANKYNIPVVEDAAEALGSEYKGKKCGTIGVYGVLSFNGNKIITTSGGGALICPTKEAADKVKFFATQARDAAPHYQHSHIGYNYRMSNVCAGIGRGQMLVLEKHIARRREIHKFYRSLLAKIDSVSLFENPSKEFNSNHWLSCILVNDANRERLRLELESANIESRPLWKPMHLQPIFAQAPFYGDGTSDRLFDNGLCLPSGSSLTDADIESVIEVILK